MGEFEVIRTYFQRPAANAVLGVGDDCALLALASGMQLAISTDTMVEGRHFVSTVDPHRLGHKALAVNLSDLAACAAKPLAFTLALTMPDTNDDFLQAFSAGLLSLAQAHGCDLIGGDTTRGPLSIGITVFGEIPEGQALLRSTAQPGDDLYVSGCLGDARLALEVMRGRVQLPGEGFEQARLALEQPTPRVALGLALRGLAHSAIDVSDGFLGDLGHVLRSSHLQAQVDVDGLPRSRLLAQQSAHWQRECTLAGGDDYELLFSASAGLAQVLDKVAQECGVPITRVGRLLQGPQPGKVQLLDHHGREVAQTYASFDHFSSSP